MTFDETLAQVRELLEREGRVAYRQGERDRVRGLEEHALRQAPEPCLYKSASTFTLALSSLER